MKLLDKLLGIRRPVPISDVATDQLVRIAGSVRCVQPLVAPYTKRPCVYWRLEVVHSAFRNDWLDTSAEQCDFEIYEASGRATVFAERSTFEVVANVVEMERVSSASELARRLARGRGLRLAEIATIEINEAIVEMGSNVIVEGRGIREVEPGGMGETGYREASVSSRLVFSGGAKVIGASREGVFLQAGRDYRVSP